MIKSVEEGLEVYKNLSKELLKEKAILKNKCGHTNVKECTWEDSQPVIVANCKLKVMVEVLKLTEAEMQAINEEVEKEFEASIM